VNRRSLTLGPGESAWIVSGCPTVRRACLIGEGPSAGMRDWLAKNRDSFRIL
jgi:hypothetical protein